jgi:hypothetical protein
MAKTQTLEAGLVGWRERFAQKIEKPVTKRTPLTGKQLRAILGALFFVKSTLYVGRAIRQAIAQSRGGASERLRERRARLARLPGRLRSVR